MESKRTKRWMVAVLMAVLFLPLLQRQFNLVEEGKLHGYFEPLPAPALKWENWFNGRLQDSLVLRANGVVGFRNHLFRLHNQVYYSLFRMAKANGVVVGKEGFLYDKAHIQAYAGKDLMDVSSLKRRFQMLSDLNRVWRQKGIHFQIVVVPDKATAMPEFLPNGAPEPGKVTNYAQHLTLADSFQIPVLDLLKWYGTHKQQDPNPLYPAGGIHWSNYCATLAADTLVGYLQSRTGKPLNRMKITGLRRSEQEEGEDGDVARGMNLLFPLKSRPAVYPELKWSDVPRKLKVLTVGDSYYFYAFTNLMGHVFESNHFYFYFRDLHVDGQPNTFPKKDVDLLKEMESQDVILLYCSSANLPELGWGFIEQAWKTYFDPATRGPYLARIQAKIKQDENWMRLIAEKAKAKGISQEEALAADALYVWENMRQL